MDDKEKRFQKSSKYFTITAYAVVGFLICALIVKVIFDFASVSNAVRVILNILAPFIIGIIIAYLINPVYKFFDNKFFGKWLHMTKHEKLRKILALLISYIIVLGLLGILIYIIIPQFAASIRSLVDTIGAFAKTLQGLIARLQERFTKLNLSVLSESLENLVPKLSESVKKWAEALVSGIVSTSVGVITAIINFFLAFVISIYILFEKDVLKNTVKKFYYSIFKEKTAANVSRLSRECSDIFGNFFTGKIIDSVIMGILVGLVMLIFRLPNALLIAVIVAVTNIIPYFGPLIGEILGFLIMLMSSWQQALLLLILLLLLQQVDGNFIGPKIIGNSTGLSPLWVIFAITIGGKIGGVAGMLFGVPVMAVIAHIAEEIVNHRLERKGLGYMITKDDDSGEKKKKKSLKERFKRKKKKKDEAPEEAQTEEPETADEKKD